MSNNVVLLNKLAEMEELSTKILLAHKRYVDKAKLCIIENMEQIFKGDELNFYVQHILTSLRERNKNEQINGD